MVKKNYSRSKAKKSTGKRPSAGPQSSRYRTAILARNKVAKRVTSKKSSKFTAKEMALFRQAFREHKEGVKDASQKRTR